MAISDKVILLWLPLFLVMVVEHLFLVYVYGKYSSLQRLFKPSSSAKTDISIWCVFYLLWPYLRVVASLITIPGILFLVLKYFSGVMQWQAPLQPLMPPNPVLAGVIWLIAIDFAVYVAHLSMHKFSFLWTFHKVHHAATEFNVITGTRVALPEKFTNDIAIFFFVAIVLGIPKPEVGFAVLFVRRLVDLLQHSDLPWDFGPLGFIIASPRFHRMHHSSNSADHDSNFGNIFAFWDYLFGTVAVRYRVSKSAADHCVLGLADREETSRINENPVAAFLPGRVFSYVISRASECVRLGVIKVVRSRPDLQVVRKLLKF